MKRFVCLLLSVSLVVSSLLSCSVVSFADDTTEPVLQTWLEEGQEWFCEEHHVLRGIPPDGSEQFCPYCRRSMSVYGAADPDGDNAFTELLCWEDPSVTTPMPTYAGEDGVVIWGLPKGYHYAGSGMDLVFVGLRVKYVAPWQPKQLYDGASLTFYYGARFGLNPDWDWQIVSAADDYFVSPNIGTGVIDLSDLETQCLSANTAVTDFNSTYIHNWISLYDFGTSVDVEFGSNQRSIWLLLPFAVPDIDGNAFPSNNDQFYMTAPYTDPEGSTTLDPESPGYDILGGIFEMIKAIFDAIVNLPANIAAAIKGFFDMVVNAIVQLGQTIIDGLKSLFIPSDGYFEGKAEEMRTWLEDHLGLLVYPFTLIVDTANRVLNIQTGEPYAHIPEIAFQQGEVKQVLIEEQDVYIYDAVGRNETLLQIHQYYLMFMDAAIAVALASMALRKFNEITGGGGQ